MKQSGSERLKQGCLLACQAETIAMSLPINLGKDVTFYLFNVNNINRETINRVSLTLADKYSENFVSQLDVIKLFQALSRIITDYKWLIAEETLRGVKNED